MPAPAMTESYSPPWAPHVAGVYSKRVQDPETGQPEEQLWAAECGVCKEKYGPAPCASGFVRAHISNFAKAHVHRDVMRDPFPGGKT